MTSGIKVLCFFVCTETLNLCFVSTVPREQLLQTEEYDLNVVRLCFQVFLQDETGMYNTALPPIVSNPIYDNSEFTQIKSSWKLFVWLHTNTDSASDLYLVYLDL